MTTKEELEKVYNEYVTTAELWNANNNDERVDPERTFYTISHRFLSYLLLSMEVYDKKSKEAWGPPPSSEI